MEEDNAPENSREDAKERVRIIEKWVDTLEQHINDPGGFNHLNERLSRYIKQSMDMYKDLEPEVDDESADSDAEEDAWEIENLYRRDRRTFAEFSGRPNVDKILDPFARMKHAKDRVDYLTKKMEEQTRKK